MYERKKLYFNGIYERIRYIGVNLDWLRVSMRF